jgi:hypothetical protein
MARSTSVLLCVVAVLLVSSAANATLVWTNPYSVAGGWGINPVMSADFYMPQYDPSLYGGAELQAVRFDLRTDPNQLSFAVGNPSDNPLYGLATVSGSFELFDPSAPDTVFAETQHTYSQWMAVPPWTLANGNAIDIPRSAVGIVTTNLAPFVGSMYSPAIVGIRTTDDSSWTGTDGAQLMYNLSGMANISVYYGYDDGTPARTPEPGTLLLFAAGLPALGFIRRRRRE